MNRALQTMPLRTACLALLGLALAAGACSDGGDPISFEAWSQDAVEQAAAQGQPVVIKFTAEW